MSADVRGNLSAEQRREVDAILNRSMAVSAEPAPIAVLERARDGLQRGIDQLERAEMHGRRKRS